ncbi:Hint domain-containing protein [Phaeovulum sp. W22_SRMD_FR3]|uniref:Hint domain-containing protein n=1 Tax=Phaeovulum sp. W22_SRMD_FR3 TaxID=3240274 RepID=UPI003F9C4BCE
MATRHIYQPGYSGPLGPDDIVLSGSGQVLSVTNPADIYVVGADVTQSFSFSNGVGSAPISAQVHFDASASNSSVIHTVTFNAGINPDVVVADGVDMGNFNLTSAWGGTSLDQFNLTLGDNAAIGRVYLSGSGAAGAHNDINIALGDGATLGNAGGTAIDVGGSYLDVTITSGPNAVIDGAIAIGGGYGSYELTLGAGTAVNGAITWGGSSNVNTATFGDGVTVGGGIYLGGSGNTQTFIAGDNVHIAGPLAVGGGNNDNTFTFGDGATIDGAVTGSISGSETWTFGDNWSFGSSFSLQGGDDTLILGTTNRDSSGTISGGSGNDTLVLHIPRDQEAAFASSATAAGWTQNPDGSWNTQGHALTYNGATFTSFEAARTFPCFASGTRIDTPDGARPVEDLRAGDLVLTRDCGPLPLIWVGARRVTFTDAGSQQRPIRLPAGALGPDQPCRALIVSPQHHLLVHQADAPQNVLVPAKALVGMWGVQEMRGCKEVTYHALLLDGHHILSAEGAAVESLYPGPMAQRMLGRRNWVDLVRRLPSLCGADHAAFGPHVRPTLRKRKACEMLAAGALRKAAHQLH